jgi:hypothetical protein
MTIPKHYRYPDGFDIRCPGCAGSGILRAGADQRDHHAMIKELQARVEELRRLLRDAGVKLHSEELQLGPFGILFKD